MAKSKQKSDSKPVSNETIEDPRFAKLHSDPRFSRAPREVSKVVIDKRFKSVLTDSRFKDVPTTKRSISRDASSRHKQKKSSDSGLNSLYTLQDGENETEPKADMTADQLSGQSSDQSGATDHEISDSENAPGALNLEARLDYLNAMARGEVVDSDDDASSDSSALEMVRVGSDEEDAVSIASGELSDGETRAADLRAEAPQIDDEIENIDATRRLALVNCDWDRLGAVDILATMQSFAPSGGTVIKVSVYPSEYGLKKMEEEARYGPRALWLGGNTANPELEAVVRRNAARKNKEKDDKHSDEQLDDNDEADEGSNTETEEESEGEAFDPIRLRQYELNKLKYFYAIIESDSVRTSAAIYKECDGMEWEHSANTMDLRYVPDDFQVTHAPARDSATEIPADYVPPAFYTKALQASRVELTWDKGDNDRAEMLRWKGNLTRAEKKSRKKRLKQRGNVQGDDNEEDTIIGLRLDDDKYAQYLANSGEESDTSSLSDDSESDIDNKTEKNMKKTAKQKQKQEKRDKYRALLLGDVLGDLANEPQNTSQGEMEVSFTPGLSEKMEQLDAEQRKKHKKRQQKRNGSDEESETVWESYLRKRKEKRRERRDNARQQKYETRKAEMKARQEELGEVDDGQHGDLLSQDNDELNTDLMDDPFFASAQREIDAEAFGPTHETHFRGKTSEQLAMDRKQKQAMKEKAAAEREALRDQKNKERAQLELLMMSNDASKVSDGEDSDTREYERVRRHKKDKKRKSNHKETEDSVYVDTDLKAAQAMGIVTSSKATVASSKDGIDIQDERFAAVHEDPKFQLDPTNPLYKDTPSTRALIAEKHKRRRAKKNKHTMPPTNNSQSSATSAMAANLKSKFASKKRMGSKESASRSTKRTKS